METIRTTNRIHPLMAAAALSVIMVSLTGAAAITGLLPSSHSEPAPLAPQAVGSYGIQPVGYPAAMGAPVAAQVATGAVVPAAPVMVPATYVQAVQPLQPVQAAPESAPAPVKKAAPKPKTVHVHHYHTTTQVARNGEPRYYPQPAPAPVQRQPNYVGIGTGAVIGGLIGNQIGGGNGKTLATVAGVIGGGMIGNEIANRNR
jgi:uncharacterized protein YcfJ